MSDDYTTFAIDPESAARLAADGLRLGLLDAKHDGFVAWMEAINRGFHEPRPNQEFLEARRIKAPRRRMTGVWDDTLADPGSPVATASSWPTEMTVPGDANVTGWAISTITVSPTHRRRGIASAMLEAELRTASALGIPVAILTASEATIYRRWGFAPAAMNATWTVDTRRASWTGPGTSGRVQYVTSDQLLADGQVILERMRPTVPGLIEFSGQLWDRLLGVGVGDDEAARALRFLRYDDAEGTAQGFAIYKVLEEETHSGAAIVEVPHLAAATDDAYAGLWRFLFELDLVHQVRAPMRPVAEPFAWQIADYRAAVKSNERDHLWARILDVPAALEARRYGAQGHFVFEVTDPLGFAEGSWLLDVASDGTGTATALDDTSGGPVVMGSAGLADHAVRVSLDVNELGAIYLGGVSAALLAKAGKITEVTPRAAVALDAAFHSAVTPWLSIWF